MPSQHVLVMPKVHAPDLDEAFLSPERWQAIPSIPLVRAEDGEPATLPTDVQAAWSARGVHILFCCTDPVPFSGDTARQAHITGKEMVAVLLDPVGNRTQYMAIFADPSGRVEDLRIEEPLRHRIGSEMDPSWDCPGLRVRSWSQQARWAVEMCIPFDGITPVIAPPNPGDRWTGNFYRIERIPVREITAWRPTFASPPDLYASGCFGVLEFGGLTK